MIRILIVFAIISISIKAFAQAEESDSSDYMLNDSISFSGFIAPTFSFSRIEGKVGMTLGGSGGILISNHFLVGGYGKALSSRHSLSRGINIDKELDLSHGGIWIGYVLFPDKRFYAIFSCEGGWGGLSLIPAGEKYPKKEDFDKIMVITPITEINFKLSPMFNMGIGTNYQLVFNTDIDQYDDSDFSGLGLYISLKIGRLSGSFDEE